MFLGIYLYQNVVLKWLKGNMVLMEAWGHKYIYLKLCLRKKVVRIKVKGQYYQIKFDNLGVSYTSIMTCLVCIIKSFIYMLGK